MKVVTAEQMAQIDAYAIKTSGIPGLKLMESAGKKVAEAAMHALRFIDGRKRVVLFAWHGNNGGDAFVAARYLLERRSDIETKLIFLSTVDKLKDDALAHYKHLVEDHPRAVIHAETLEKLIETRDIAFKAHLIIDGIFGTGFRGSPEGHPSESIFFINGLNKPVLAIDIPSGVNGTTGEVKTIAVNARITVTFGLPKRGLLFKDGPRYAGKIIVADIGFPQDAIDTVNSTLECLDPRKIKKNLPQRPVDGHKMSFGHLFVLAGSEGLTGAAMLASMAALRSGCGMVTLGCPASLNPIFETALTEVITVPLPETEKKTLSDNCIDQVFSTMKHRRCNGLLVGPGLGTHPSTSELVVQIAKQTEYPLILDADALNAIASVSPDVLKECRKPLIVTPHPGELGRLMDLTSAEIQSDRQQYVEQFARNYGTVTILKGKNTVIAHSQLPSYINLSGNTGLATAGTGDVLAGMIGSFLVQGLSPLEAACTGVFFHGKIADYALPFIGERSLIASDLIKYLPEVLR